MPLNSYGPFRDATQNYKTVDDVDSGSITSATVSSLTDTTKNWVVNSLVDKVVRVDISANEWFFAIIASNTNNSLIFDDPALKVPSGTYRIIQAFVCDRVDTIIAIDMRDNCGAVILPLSTSLVERGSIHVYVERANNGDHITPLICRGTDRQLGVKYGTLEHQAEGIKFYGHMWGTPHWDILQVYSVERHLAVHTISNNVVNTTNYVELFNAGTTTPDYAKRFKVLVKSGKAWAKYTSLYEKKFVISGSFTLTNVSGTPSIVTFAVRRFNYATGITEDVTIITPSARLPNNSEVTIGFSFQITLKYSDEIAAIAKVDAGQVTLLTGSNYVMHEL